MPRGTTLDERDLLGVVQMGREGRCHGVPLARPHHDHDPSLGADRRQSGAHRAHQHGDAGDLEQHLVHRDAVDQRADPGARARAEHHRRRPLHAANLAEGAGRRDFHSCYIAKQGAHTRSLSVRAVVRRWRGGVG